MAIIIKPYLDEGWQRFIAVDECINSLPDGPCGFGRTEDEARQDLINDDYYQRLLKISQSTG